jgi:hypothetical protein
VWKVHIRVSECMGLVGYRVAKRGHQCRGQCTLTHTLADYYTLHTTQYCPPETYWYCTHAFNVCTGTALTMHTGTVLTIHTGTSLTVHTGTALTMHTGTALTTHYSLPTWNIA